MEPSRRSEGQSHSSDAVSFTAHSPSVRSHMRSERYIVESHGTSFRLFRLFVSLRIALRVSRTIVYNFVNTVSSFRVKWILSFFHTSSSLPSQFTSFRAPRHRSQKQDLEHLSSK